MDQQERQTYEKVINDLKEFTYKDYLVMFEYTAKDIKEKYPFFNAKEFRKQKQAMIDFYTALLNKGE